MTKAKFWFVYLLESLEHGTFYIGATVDVHRRLEQHNTGKGGFHTRSRRPWLLRGFIRCENRSEALKLEAKLKKLPKNQKEKAFSVNQKNEEPMPGVR